MGEKLAPTEKRQEKTWSCMWGKGVAGEICRQRGGNLSFFFDFSHLREANYFEVSEKPGEKQPRRRKRVLWETSAPLYKSMGFKNQQIRGSLHNNNFRKSFLAVS